MGFQSFALLPLCASVGRCEAERCSQECNGSPGPLLLLLLLPRVCWPPKFTLQFGRYFCSVRGETRLMMFVVPLLAAPLLTKSADARRATVDDALAFRRARAR